MLLLRLLDDLEATPATVASSVATCMPPPNLSKKPLSPGNFSVRTDSPPFPLAPFILSTSVPAASTKLVKGVSEFPKKSATLLSLVAPFAILLAAFEDCC